MIGLDPASASGLTPEQREQLTITVQPGSMIGPDGQPLAGAQVGISLVPPELVRDMLPPGAHATPRRSRSRRPGWRRFTTPVRMTFPNVFEAAPGTKLNVLSFDHTTGRLEITGTATVSAGRPDGDHRSGQRHHAPGLVRDVPPGGCGARQTERRRFPHHWRRCGSTNRSCCPLPPVTTRSSTSPDCSGWLRRPPS